MSCYELLDIVSETDEIIGQATRDVIYDKKLYFRVINAFICNAEKKLWVPRRHPQKKLFPLHLDCSVGGHVASGESYDNAFIRETQEELNIDVTKITYEKIARLTPIENNTSAFMWVYIIYSQEAPIFNQDDFIEYYWLSIDEIFEQLNNGDKAKGDLLPILNEIKAKL